jgi:hypothetical protein
MKEWERRIGMADQYGTCATVSFYPADDEVDEPAMCVSLGIGQCESRCYPTAVAARQMAAALLDAAEAFDAASSDNETRRE